MGAILGQRSNRINGLAIGLGLAVRLQGQHTENSVEITEWFFNWYKLGRIKGIAYRLPTPTATDFSQVAPDQMCQDINGKLQPL